MVMYGITVKPVNISSAENRKAQRWLWSASTCVMPPSAVLPRAACRCAVSVGSVRAACRASSATSAAIAKNGGGVPPAILGQEQPQRHAGHRRYGKRGHHDAHRAAAPLERDHIRHDGLRQG